MAILLNCNSITKPQIVASSALPDDSSPSLPQSPLIIKPNIKLPKQNYKKLQQNMKQKQQPSILEIERAIGAGIFRDRDINSEEEEGEKRSLFDNMLRNSVGKSEGPIEKKLRESGEWLNYQTQKTSRSAGKQILKVMFIWIIPMWILAFFVATGIVHLPFTTPFIEDLIS